MNRILAFFSLNPQNQSDPRPWYKDALVWLLFVPPLYAVLCMGSLATDIGRPFPSFLTYYTPRFFHMGIEWNVPTWWWGVQEQGLTVEDYLLQVEGIPFTQIDKAPPEAALYQNLWDNGASQIVVAVTQGHTLRTLTAQSVDERTLTIPLTLFSITNYVDLLFVPVITSLTYWLVALILCRAARETSQERLFILILIVFSFVGFGVRPSLFSLTEWWRYPLTFVNPLYFFPFIFAGALFFHFGILFPTLRWPRLAQWGLPIMYGLSLLLYLTLWGSRVLFLQGGNIQWVHWSDIVWFDGYQYLVGVGIVFLFGRLFAELFRWPRQSREWQQTAVFVGAFFLFFPTVLFALPMLDSWLGTWGWLGLLADPRFTSLAIPLGLATITLRYRTFTGAQVWLLVVLMMAVSGFVATLGVAFLFWQVPELVRSLPFPPTAVLFLFFFSLSLLWGWQSSWRGLLGKVLHWERVSYNQALTFGRQLAVNSYANEQALARGMAVTLTEALGVRYTAVYLAQNSQMSLAATHGDLPPDLPASLPTPAPFPTQPYRPASNQPLAKLFPVWLPLWGEGDAVGMIGVGERWDTAVFTDPDLEILDLVAQQAAIFLQNSRQTSQLRQADQQLIHIQEQTQRKTAQDLHDHVVPALAQLQLQLQTTKHLLAHNPDQAEAQLTDSLARLKENTAVVRRIQKALGVRPLEYGLTPYLQEMVQQFRQDSGLAVTVQWLDNLDQLLPQLEARHALYSVWQEALNNVQTHAQATHVTIRLATVVDEGAEGKRWLHFEIRDNGRGSSEHGREQALRTGHIGLRSMQIRLESVGGKFAFQSTAGHGTAVVGWLPLI